MNPDNKKPPRGLPPKVTDHRITLAKAVGLTKRYRRSAPASEHGGFFWAEALRALLAQPGVVGMRFYHGLDEKGAYRLVLVGVDSQGRDIVKAEAAPRPKAKSVARSATSGEAVILDTHWPCPPVCWEDSPLN